MNAPLVLLLYEMSDQCSPRLITSVINWGILLERDRPLKERKREDLLL